MAHHTGHDGAPPSRIVVQNVTKWFRSSRANVHALDNISMEVAAGEILCLVGPSGCGKSTFLDIIAGLTRPDAGVVLSDGQPIEGPARNRMVMFQEPALFPWLDVFGNIMFGLNRNPALTRQERRRIADDHLRLVGLERFRNAYVHELSGGMKQRIALARALAPDPHVLLMDEPLAALDALTREQLYGDIQRIWQSRRKTIILVTHDVREAVCLGDRVIVLSPRPGRLCEEFGIPLTRPRDINAPELASYAQRITAALKSRLPKDES
jgi:NitT/TauT family transport system ATP-binding protein